jgi:hypothetical protein
LTRKPTHIAVSVMKKRASRGGAGPLIPADYASLLAEVKARILAAQYEALRAVKGVAQPLLGHRPDHL